MLCNNIILVLVEEQFSLISDLQMTEIKDTCSAKKEQITYSILESERVLILICILFIIYYLLYL